MLLIALAVIIVGISGFMKFIPPAPMPGIQVATEQQ